MKIISYCVACRRVQRENGTWGEVEEASLLNARSSLQRSLCPACAGMVFAEAALNDEQVAQPLNISGLVRFLENFENKKQSNLETRKGNGAVVQ